MLNISYYRSIALLYDAIVPRDIKGVCDSLEEIIKRYTNRKAILDLGCGTGRFTIELANRGFRMVGLDITDEMLEVARKNSKMANVKVKFIKGDIRSFKLKQKTGTIWARGSIGDLINISDVKKAFRNIRNNLLKKGIFIFDVRDFSYYIKTFKNGFRSESKVFKDRSKITNFNFSAKLNKSTKIEKMTGEITIKRGKCIKKYKVNHTLRYHTRKGITALLNNAEFNILEIRHGGYKSDQKKKPHFIVVVGK